MSYKNIEEQREYQRKWIAKRRAEYFSDKCCAECSSNKELELHHIDPTKKIAHNIWSWSKEKREKEISKCKVLCRWCHIDDHVRKRNNPFTRKFFHLESKILGENGPAAKLTEDEVRQIRKLYATGNYTQTNLSNLFGVSPPQISKIINFKHWKH